MSFVCVCVCVCEREREREREGGFLRHAHLRSKMLRWSCGCVARAVYTRWRGGGGAADALGCSMVGAQGA